MVLRDSRIFMDFLGMVDGFQNLLWTTILLLISHEHVNVTVPGVRSRYR